MGRLLIALGLMLLVAGLLWQSAPGTLGWFGRLPGDLRFGAGRTRVFIPITSMVIVSIVLSLLLRWLRR